MLYTISVKFCLVEGIVKRGVFLTSIAVGNLICGLLTSAIPDDAGRILALLNYIVCSCAIHCEMTGDFDVLVHIFILPYL